MSIALVPLNQTRTTQTPQHNIGVQIVASLASGILSTASLGLTLTSRVLYIVPILRLLSPAMQRIVDMINTSISPHAFPQFNKAARVLNVINLVFIKRITPFGSDDIDRSDLRYLPPGKFAKWNAYDFDWFWKELPIYLIFKHNYLKC